MSLNLVCFGTFRYHKTNSFPKRLFLRFWSLVALTKGLRLLFVRCSTKSTWHTWKIVPPNSNAANRRSAFFLPTAVIPSKNNFSNTIEHCDRFLSELLAKKMVSATSIRNHVPCLCWRLEISCSADFLLVFLTLHTAMSAVSDNHFRCHFLRSRGDPN